MVAEALEIEKYGLNVIYGYSDNGHSVSKDAEDFYAKITKGSLPTTVFVDSNGYINHTYNQILWWSTIDLDDLLTKQTFGK